MGFRKETGEKDASSAQRCPLKSLVEREGVLCLQKRKPRKEFTSKSDEGLLVILMSKKRWAVSVLLVFSFLAIFGHLLAQ